MSAELHDVATLTPVTLSPASIGQESGWASDYVSKALKKR